MVQHPAFHVGDHLSLITLGSAGLFIRRHLLPSEPALESGKPFALITYLALSPRQTVSRERLIDLLWTNLEPDEARRALRQTLWLLRRKIGDGALGSTNDLVTLLVPVDCDRDAVLIAWENDKHDDVIRIYRGEFLPSFATPGGAEFERWADEERRRLRSIYLRSAEIVVRNRLAIGHRKDAETLARQVRDADPLNQSGWRLLLECLVAGRDAVGGALEAGELERRFAQEELEPEAATRALLRAARSISAVARTISTDARHPLPVAELVGREREFSTILHSWDVARDGRFVHLHICAPPGFGKTRLLGDLHARLRASLARTVEVRANLGTRDIAFAFTGILAAALAARPGARGISPLCASALVALNPTLSASFDAPPDTATGDEALRHRALALRELVGILTEDHPLAILLDDLHWCDLESLRLLEALFSMLERARVLVVSAGREATSTQRATAAATPLVLDALTPDDIGTLISSIAPLPAEPWADGLAVGVWTASRGSPLFALETLNLLNDRDLLTPAADGWSTTDAIALERTLTEGSALLRRLDDLADMERRVLLLLSIGGLPLSVTHLLAAAGIPADVLDATLLSLERRGIARRLENSWTTAHDEHAAASIASASEDSRRTASAAVGRALSRDAHGDPRLLRLAASLLAFGGDARTLEQVFEEFIREARLKGDLRSNRTLARELLGTDATDILERSLVQSLSWLVRARLVTPRRILASTAIILLAPVSLGALVAGWRGASDHPPDFVLAAMRPANNHTTYDVYELPVDTRGWVGVGAIDVAMRGSPRWRIPFGGIGGTTLRPDGRGWTMGRTVKDTGVIDLIDVDVDGRERRLTFARGDDYQASWAPDNSAFAFTTTRWSSRARSDIAVYDTLTRSVRAITRGDDWDSSPVWSRDGSRIAFIRRAWPTAEHSLCAVDVDASHLRCRSLRLGVPIAALRWTDPHRLLVELTAANRSQLAIVDVDGGTEAITDSMAEVSASAVSPDGRWVVCRCARPGHVSRPWIVFSIDRPGEFKVLRASGVDPANVDFAWAPTTPHAPFLDGLHIARGPGLPMLGASYQLRVVGADRGRHPIDAGVVRWRSLDTAIASIDSVGRMMPRALGHVRIEASAGGWKQVTETIEIVAPLTHTLLDENWSDPLSAHWILYGTPHPVIVAGQPFGRAFLNNGPGIFRSGAYSRSSFDTREGLWLDAELSMPITAPEWQEGYMTILTVADSTALSRWDRIHDYLPGLGPACSIIYPKGEGNRSGDSLALSTRSLADYEHVVAAPEGARYGRPFNALIQVLPDGRCGFAINGKAMWVSEPHINGEQARIALEGNSAGTRIVVGHMVMSRGLARHVDWPK